MLSLMDASRSFGWELVRDVVDIVATRQADPLGLKRPSADTKVVLDVHGPLDQLHACVIQVV